MASKKLRKQWLLFVRWTFRKCGGYHITEHLELHAREDAIHKVTHGN